jgi:hypothetical protein
MEYHYLPPASGLLSAPSAQVPVPFALKPVVTIEEDGGASDHKYRLSLTNSHVPGSFHIGLISRLLTEISGPAGF